jgi:hypothetical protein
MYININIMGGVVTRAREEKENWAGHIPRKQKRPPHPLTAPQTGRMTGWTREERLVLLPLWYRTWITLNRIVPHLHGRRKVQTRRGWTWFKMEYTRIKATRMN